MHYLHKSTCIQSLIYTNAFKQLGEEVPIGTNQDREHLQIKVYSSSCGENDVRHTLNRIFIHPYIHANLLIFTYMHTNTYILIYMYINTHIHKNACQQTYLLNKCIPTNIFNKQMYVNIHTMDQ